MPLTTIPIIDTQTRTATIAISTSLSAAIALPPGWYPAAILMPAAWTAADLTFQLSLDGTTFADLYDDAGTEVTAKAAAARYITLDPLEFRTARAIKLRSGTAASAVNQEAARTLILVLRPTQ